MITAFADPFGCIWASDACAIEAAPPLRKTPRGQVVPFNEIMNAMRALEKEFLAEKSTRSKSHSAKDERTR